MREHKRQLRTEMLARRQALPAAQLDLWNHRIQKQALQFTPYLMARSVALYSSIGNEVATDEIRDHALRAHKRVFYPKMGAKDGLDLVEVRSAEELRLGPHGILEPIGSRTLGEEAQETLIVFVPGVVFDLHGNRLGRGRSWYDRLIDYLGDGPGLVGCAYEFQIVEAVPVEARDRKVHYLITERRVIDCRALTSRSEGLT